MFKRKAHVAGCKIGWFAHNKKRHNPRHKPFAGPRFSYEERQASSNPFFAFLGSLVFIIAAGLLPLAARFSFIRNLLPQPGTGGSRESMEKGHWHVANFASGTDSHGVKKVAEAHFKVRHTRAVGAFASACICFKCARCAESESAQEHMCPSLGHAKAGRLKRTSAPALHRSQQRE